MAPLRPSMRLSFSLVLALVSEMPRCSNGAGPKEHDLPALVEGLLGEFGDGVANAKIKDCVPMGEVHALVRRITAAHDKMLEKRNSTMRIGLGKLGRGVALLAGVVLSKCDGLSAHAEALKALALKLEGYGEDKAFFEYRKMEKLKVDGYDIHKPLNTFLHSWKRDPADGKEIGGALGKFFKVFGAEKPADAKDTATAEL